MGTDVFSFLLVVALAASGCVAQPEVHAIPAAGQAVPGKAVPGELIVMFVPDTPDQRRAEIHQSAGGQVLGEMHDGRIAHVKVKPGQPTEELAARYRRFTEVESVEPNYVVEPKVGERQ